MQKNGYELITDNQAEIVVEKYDVPLVAPDEYDRVWEKISEQMEAFVQEKNAQTPNSERVPFYENIANLMAGAINLINFIIERQNKTPIKTLVFLDKSARLGAHVFRVLWSTLEKQGRLPTGVTKPNIKFINVGFGEDHKHIAQRSLDLAAEMFPNEDLEGDEVLVIDEFVESGVSLRRAMKFLQDKYGTHAQGMANFLVIPKWYSYDMLKGVADPELLIEVYNYLEGVNRGVYGDPQKLHNGLRYKNHDKNSETAALSCI